MQTWPVNPAASSACVQASSVAQLVGAIASQDRTALASAILHTVQSALPSQHCAIFAHEASRNPRLLSGAGEGGPWVAIKSATAYLRDHYRADAMHQMASRRPAGIAKGEVVVCRERCEDIEAPEYREACFTALGIRERLTVLMRCATDSWLSVHIYRIAGQPSFSAQEVDSLVGLAPVIAGCVARHYASDIDGETGFRDTVTGDIGELCPSLTEREREVLMRILDGVTVNRIAEDLKLRPTTVATYRMRAYEKLGVASRRELFAAVLRRHALAQSQAPATQESGRAGTALLHAA
ncbi:helix-turn-helix transcriptional regulator [Variovorax sp. PBL-E5]|uniref:helix-turn-helix transcriptional regulator n=1 Tax=Variovorax sp. PBL-E5 TaxID=434014 RepID=UPI001316522D|nr:helix-turn-helix transcriptional regulator [Variovorax sp. PBL-E5]VTU45134.1 Response regulator UvrY [Variovorax sp. PBL-E5]